MLNDPFSQTFVYAAPIDGDWGNKKQPPNLVYPDTEKGMLDSINSFMYTNLILNDFDLLVNLLKQFKLEYTVSYKSDNSKVVTMLTLKFSFDKDDKFIGLETV